MPSKSQNKRDNNPKNDYSCKKIDTEDILTLMNIYLTEWCHRDQLLWKQVYAFFYVTLIVLFLPNLTTFIGIDLPSNFPSFVFPAIAFFMSIVFLIVSIGYAMRLQASSESYRRVMTCLPDCLQRTSINDEIEKGKFRRVKTVFTFRMTYFLCITMFVSLMLLSILMIAYYYKVYFS